MSDACTWIVFHAHPTRLVESKKEHADFYGTFVCPASRSEPDQLLAEVLANRKLFLAKIVDRRSKVRADDWGMNERLKAQVQEQGFGLALTKIHHGLVPRD